MEAYVLNDAMRVAKGQGLGFTKLLPRRSNFSVYGDQLPTATSALQISAIVDAVAPPPVKPNPYKTRSGRITRRKRRTKRLLFSGDDIINGENFWYYVTPGGDGMDGGGSGSSDGGSGNGNGDGYGWNFGGFGEQNWDDSSWLPPWGSGFAFDFFYEVVYWIALSKCVHFAFKKLVRPIAGGIGRGKVPIRLTTIC